ncbi:MAG: T9SS type A sorting domain-containing protein [candidate division Zixibacteria bacterium]|nr:T9SS type A sorting domain-containing protein [candidate division Zixibacteria bacterium]
MKQRLFIGAMVIFLSSGLSSALGQCNDSLDFGVCDTVRVGCVKYEAGDVPSDSFGVPIYIYSDYPIAAFSLGFHYDNDCIEATSLSLTGSAIPEHNKVYGQLIFDSASNLCNFWWLDYMSNGRIPPAPDSVGQLVGTIYFKLFACAYDSAQRMALDSIYYLPSSDFMITVDTSSSDTIALTCGLKGIYFLHCDTTRKLDIWLDAGERYNEVNLPPRFFSLGQNAPNPFNPNTVIEFAVPQSGDVRVEVFNVLGQRVNVLVDDFLDAGRHQVGWDGTDASGRSVSSGIYFYRMTAGEFSDTRKMMLLK